MKLAILPALDVNIVWLSEIDSTNAMAARLVAGWAEDEDDRLKDTLIVAATQTAGRGRNAHAWESPVGGLYATWLGWLSTPALGWLPIAAGVGLARAVEDALPAVSVGLKWPNDLLVGGKKLAGVLCQSRTRGDSAWAAVGFGVNIGVTPRLADGSTAEAVSLGALGLGLAVEEALWVIVQGFVRRLRGSLDQPAELRAAWLSRAVHHEGDPLRIRSGDEVVIGAYLGLAEDGHLELLVERERRCFAAGELVGELPETGG